jgi:hypothetical protein
LLGCVSFAGDPIRYARILGLVSFDCHPGSPFFSHPRRTLLFLVSVFSFGHHSFSPQKATPVPTTTLALSPQMATRSISLLRCPRWLVLFATASCARSEDTLNFFPQKVGAAAGRPVACATVKGASGHQPWHHPKQTPPCSLPLGLGAVLRAVAAAATPPPILLLGRTRLVRIKSTSRWKLIAPFY